MDFTFPHKTLRLNGEQSAAVLRDPHAHQRILASAGSGKTTTLTARIAWLITHHGIKAESIVLMTFSRNAAQQMVSRISDLIGVNGVWAGTFHGLARNLLRTYEPTRLATLYFVDELIGMGTQWLLTPKGRNWVSKLRYIVVDEFQDINAAQWKMVERMLHPGARLLVVGDDAQNIYTWRGSDVKFILDLEKKVPGLLDDQLRINYRSSESIIACANAVMRYIPTLSWKKAMEGCQRSLGRKPDVHFFWRQKDEFQWIVREVRSILDIKADCTIAVLSRTNLDLFRLEEEFLDAKIPYRLRDVGGKAAGVAEEEGATAEPDCRLDLVTLHASKGLEWDIVFVLHCNDDAFPSSKKKEDIICERRLFYVAVTRARRHLVFTYNRNERDLSRFVREIPTRLLQYHGLARYCLSEHELEEGTPTLEHMVGSLDGDDFAALRADGVLDWLDIRCLQEEYLFPPGESWVLPPWARKPEWAKDFLRFLRVYLKRLFVCLRPNDLQYRDPVAERLLFTLRVFAEDRPFWEQWEDELKRFIFTTFRGDEAARVPPPIDYATVSDWCKRQNLFWTPKEILAATSLIAKIRGQLRPLRFEKYDLYEFTIRPARFVVPTEMRGDVLRSWRRVSQTDLPSQDCLLDIWKIGALATVAEGRNAPLHRVGSVAEFLKDGELVEFLDALETYLEAWTQRQTDMQVSMEIDSDLCHPELVDMYADGVFWRIAGEEKERFNSLRLLILALVAGFAQQQGLDVHSIGMMYPLEGRCVKVRLPDDWSQKMMRILERTKVH